MDWTSKVSQEEYSCLILVGCTHWIWWCDWDSRFGGHAMFKLRVSFSPFSYFLVVEVNFFGNELELHENEHGLWIYRQNLNQLYIIYRGFTR